MTHPKPLSGADLFHRCDPALLPFETTEELEELDEFVGQDRAVEAVKFAIGMKGKGYNLFAFGPQGTGKSSLVRRILNSKARKLPVPSDICYVNNFEDSHKPSVMLLDPGMGRPLARQMDRLQEDLHASIPLAFESDEYRARREVIEKALKEREEAAFEDVRKRAEERDVSLIRTTTGLALVPAKDGQMLKAEEFEELSEEEQETRKAAIEELQSELEEVVEDLPRWERSERDQIKELNREVTQHAVKHHIDELRKTYAAYSEICDYLDAVEEDIIENVEDFLISDTSRAMEGEEEEERQIRAELGFAKPGKIRRYQINVLVDNGCEAGPPCVEEACTKHEAETSNGVEDRRIPAPPGTGAPVVFEDHPTLGNIIGRVENISIQGALVTDFNLIKPGALHRANGGYLVLDAHKVLMNPFAWEALKRTISSGRIRIEGAEEAYGLANTVTLEPEPIKLDVKVILLGEPELYYMLSHYDQDFRELFKVAADFDDRMERDGDSVYKYARLISTIASQEGLLPLERGAVARLVEHASRTCEDNTRLTTHLASVVDVIREAHYWAERDGATAVITRDHIQQAIDQRVYRSDRIRERIHEEIKDGTIRIMTSGEAVGEINGLAVLELDHFAFGRPSRISCRVRPGKSGVMDFEREVALSGPLHSKGVLIMTSFLASRFTKDRPLSLSASLVFEQSYGGIEGDSASSTELYALISAIADVPIKQSLAVTGSVDQFGRVQAIGGVNEKIEGFFDICRTRELTGDQGVLIPATNVRHLMLREDVVAACEAGKFHIYPVETIDQGIEILTGIPAGELDEFGEYPLGTVNRLVASRLQGFARRLGEIPPRRRRSDKPAPQKDS